ncbi:MAG: hypothetical protein ACO3A4_14990 [Silvanigrellaceae bacterium]
MMRNINQTLAAVLLLGMTSIACGKRNESVTNLDLTKTNKILNSPGDPTPELVKTDEPAPKPGDEAVVKKDSPLLAVSAPAAKLDVSQLQKILVNGSLPGLPGVQVSVDSASKVLIESITKDLKGVDVSNKIAELSKSGIFDEILKQLDVLATKLPEVVSSTPPVAGTAASLTLLINGQTWSIDLSKLKDDSSGLKTELLVVYSKILALIPLSMAFK